MLSRAPQAARSHATRRRAENRLDIVDALFDGWNEIGRPGAVVGVTRHGRVLHNASYGLASIEYRIENCRDTVFRIGSISKQFAVFLALQLSAEGKLDIDAPAKHYLPELPEYYHPVTTRQLMQNTAGVCDFLELWTASGGGVFGPVSSAQSLDLILRQPHLNCVPGEAFVYSAGGFLVLSTIIERVESAPMEEILERRIFRTLGMRSTRLARNDRIVVPGLATPYLVPDDGEPLIGGWGTKPTARVRSSRRLTTCCAGPTRRRIRRMAGRRCSKR